MPITFRGYLFRSITYSLLLNIASASAARAQMLPTASERRTADLTSTALVLTAIALDTKASWDAPDRAHALQMQAARLFVTWVWAELAKGLVNRERPDHSDHLSFYSEHTAFAFQTMPNWQGGPRVAFVLPLAVGTGGLRVAAGKHWITDVLVGAAVGALTSRIR